MHQQFDVVVFDIGGVLVELRGASRMIEWTRLDLDELWGRWLASPAVRLFETGKATPDEFATAVCSEFTLPVAAAAFLHEFTNWSNNLFPGAQDLLRALAPRVRLASLSNTNAVHWQHIGTVLGLGDLFHQHFLSHQIGRIKPDREVFDYVVAALGCPAQRILFLDDNQINVDQAAAMGMVAHRVIGVEGARERLVALGLLGER